MALLGPAGTLPRQCHVDSAKVVPRAPQKGGGGAEAEECRQMSVGEWTSKWRQALRLHWVPLENDATKSSSLVGSCWVGLWRGGYPWHARAPRPSPSPGPLLSVPGLAASFPCLHLLLAVEAMHTATRNVFPKHCFSHVPPQIENLPWWKSQTSPLSPVDILRLTT